MIFVTLGTQDKEFPRLLKCIETNIRKGIIKDKVIVQAGSTNFKSSAMKIKDFMDRDEFKKYLTEADLIITHGGVGTILEALKNNKKVIGCARLEKYKEHVNDHQVQLLERFDEDGYIIYAKDLDDFAKYYKKAEKFKPKTYKSNQDKFNKQLDEYINQNMYKEEVEEKKEESKITKLLLQALHFFLISGMGWLMDMCIFTLLTKISPLPTMICNMISSIVAVTYVYITSTRKTFVNNSSKSLKNKYILYIIYQICMILLSSALIGLIASFLGKINIELISNYCKIIAKIIMTPVTMICNFIFMKWLIEHYGNKKKIEKSINISDSFKKQLFITLLITIVYEFLIFFETIKLFSFETIFDYIVLSVYQLIGGLIIWFLINYIIYIVKNRTKYKLNIKFFFIFFIPLFILLLLVWPGIFKGDEFDTLFSILNLKMFYQQHYLTCTFYLLSICMLPLMGSITLNQILIISFISSYIVTKIYKELKNKKLIILFILMLFLPPVIDTDLFTLRLSLISYLFLLALFELIFYQKDKNNNRLIISMLLSILIARWKTEFVFVPFAIFIYILIFYRKNYNLKQYIKRLIIYSLIFIIIGLPQRYIKVYSSTAILNPLSMLATYDDIKTTISEEDINNIEKLVSFENLKETASVISTPVYWTTDLNKTISDKEYSKFIKSYMKLVINNPLRFLKARWETFKYTNFATNEYPNHTGSEEPSSQWTLYHWKNDEYHQNKGYIRYKFRFNNGILGETVKRYIITGIQLRNPDTYNPNKLNHLFYNILPCMIIGFINLIYVTIKKKFNYAFLLLLVFTQVSLVFITAPTIFFMYYICGYISFHCLNIYSIINVLDRKC